MMALAMLQPGWCEPRGRAHHPPSPGAISSHQHSGNCCFRLAFGRRINTICVARQGLQPVTAPNRC